MKPNAVRKTFFSILSDTEKEISSFVRNPGSDMIRHRYCCFSDTVLATMNLTMNRTNTELINYFGIDNPHIPSKSAFTQQRKKFNSRLYPHLLNAFNKAIPLKKTYKGFHLIAVDGSDINLPTDKKDEVYRIRQARSERYYYQMHVNALYDICENRYVSAVMQPRPQMNERQAFCQLVKECPLPENTIFIADRGYVSLNTFAHLQEQKKLFLIRAKDPGSSGGLLRHLAESGMRSDRICSIGISRSKKNFRGKSFDKCITLSRKRAFDQIPPHDRTSVYTLTLRITCVRISEDSFEYLISNLSSERFLPSDLKKLYWKRWSVETSFRRLKYALALSYLHSVNRELIIQEVYAKMILYNFTSLLHAYAQRCRNRKRHVKKTKYDYRVSFDAAVPLSRQFLMGRLKEGIIKALLLKYLTEVKVSTASARHMRSQTVRPLNNRA